MSLAGLLGEDMFDPPKGTLLAEVFALNRLSAKMIRQRLGYP